MMRSAALGLVIALATALPATAVHVAPDGVGQALIFPYYSALPRDGNRFNTYLSIRNGDALYGKALRVRFREGRNGREVRGFNLFLPPGDMWAGAVVPYLGGTAIVTRDQSCTSPAFPIDFAPGSIPVLAFTNTAYTGANADGYGSDAERMAEGYIEALEMARFSFESPDPATHCADYIAERVAGAFGDPSGGISGTLTVINVQDGTDFTVNAVALEDLALAKYYRPPGDPYPDFNVVEMNPVSNFVEGGKLHRTQWTSPVAAVDAALQRSAVDNEVVLDTTTASATDWIFTFPTKRLHNGATPSGPFAQGALVDGRDVILGVAFSPRDLHGTTYVDACGFLCPPFTDEADLRLRWSASVLTFRATAADPGPTTSDVLGSRNAWSMSLPPGTQNGRARVSFGGMSGRPGISFASTTTRLDTGATAAESFRLLGLPVVGFMVRTFRNGSLVCTGATCQGNYGGSFPHKYARDLQP